MFSVTLSRNKDLFVCNEKICVYFHRKGKQTAPTTMRMAVNLLNDNDPEMQITAANFIQNQCFSSADAKKRVSETG